MRSLRVGIFFADLAPKMVDLAPPSHVLSIMYPSSLDIPSILSLIVYLPFSGRHAQPIISV